MCMPSACARTPRHNSGIRCMHACMHACMYACIHTCMYVCMYVYIWYVYCSQIIATVRHSLTGIVFRTKPASIYFWDIMNNTQVHRHIFCKQYSKTVAMCMNSHLISLRINNTKSIYHNGVAIPIIHHTMHEFSTIYGSQPPDSEFTKSILSV